MEVLVRGVRQVRGGEGRDGDDDGDDNDVGVPMGRSLRRKGMKN
jgi:hypothetical protein